MSRVCVAVFAMAERGHFRRLKPLIAALAAADATPYVFTDARFREEVAAAGGRFVDLFAGRPLDRIDAESIPIPSRFVSFAGHCGEEVAREAAALRPSLVVHDTFALIGDVVARRLGLPRVNVCAGHNLAPEPTVATLLRDPRVCVSEACRQGVRLLRDRFGMADASPFSYVSAVSPDLNLYCEPPQYLREDERRPFEPIAFFGSLWPDDPGHAAAPAALSAPDQAPSRTLRVYVSFGTVVWRYYEAAAVGALEAIADALSGRPDVSAIVSLGGMERSHLAAKLTRPNVRVEPYVDQWSVLRDASVCITHQGLNSTHEAVYHRVPMIAYPFFWDQPALAARCQELGLAVPLSEAVRGPVTPEMAGAAVSRVEQRLDEMRAALAAARAWEDETIRQRPAVVARVLALGR